MPWTRRKTVKTGVGVTGMEPHVLLLAMWSLVIVPIILRQTSVKQTTFVTGMIIQKSV